MAWMISSMPATRCGGRTAPTFGPVSAWTLAEWRESKRVFDTDEIRRVNGETDSDWVVLHDSEFLRHLPDEPLGWTEPE